MPAVKPKNKKAEKGRIWAPSPIQVKMAELLLNPDDKRTKGEKYKSLGVPERTFYNWMKDQRYIDYINSKLEQYTDSEVAEVWRSLLTQAKRGNVNAIKLFFEMKKMYVPKAEIEHSGEVKTTLNMSALSLEELRKLANLE